MKRCSENFSEVLSILRVCCDYIAAKYFDSKSMTILKLPYMPTVTPGIMETMIQELARILNRSDIRDASGAIINADGFDNSFISLNENKSAPLNVIMRYFHTISKLLNYYRNV